MSKLRHFIWKILGTPELPPKKFQLTKNINVYSGKTYIPRSYKMAALYQNGLSLEQIANLFDCTRERVRQCIWKAYRENEMK